MKGSIHRILNDKTVMKDVEIIIQLPGGNLKFMTLHVGDTVQITKPTKQTATKRKKAKKGLEEL